MQSHSWQSPARSTQPTRTIARRGLALGLAVLVVGVATVVGSARAANDYWLAPEPWIGLGLTLVAIGLALSVGLAVVVDFVEPVAIVWRILAVAIAAVVVLPTALIVIVGQPSSGNPGGVGGPNHDPRTLLYSQPEWMWTLVFLTALLAVPSLLVARRNQGDGI